MRTYSFISSIDKAVVNSLIVHLLCSPCSTGSAGSGSDISSWSIILWMQEGGVFGVEIATSDATIFLERTKLNLSLKDFFLNLSQWDSQCRALQRRQFWLLPLTGVWLSCCEPASIAKLDALGGDWHLSENVEKEESKN